MDLTVASALACIFLAILVYLMWKDANKAEWQAFTQEEKTKWQKKEGS
ncbi:MAG: hypothetical protein QW275_00575 [Candidatus Anstonellaceae archaeon]